MLIEVAYTPTTASASQPPSGPRGGTCPQANLAAYSRNDGANAGATPCADGWAWSQAFARRRSYRTIFPSGKRQAPRASSPVLYTVPADARKTAREAHMKSPDVRAYTIQTAQRKEPRLQTALSFPRGKSASNPPALRDMASCTARR